VKTTVEISDALLSQVRDLAHREGRTFRSVLEEALHETLRRHGEQGCFTLPDLSVGHGWLTEDWSDGGLREVLSDARERGLT